jgi:hypothetical protein
MSGWEAGLGVLDARGKACRVLVLEPKRNRIDRGYCMWVWNEAVATVWVHSMCDSITPAYTPGSRGCIQSND